MTEIVWPEILKIFTIWHFTEPRNALTASIVFCLFLYVVYLAESTINTDWINQPMNQSLMKNYNAKT